MKSPTKLRAPILIATCNRLNHFKALIDSLQACYWASETELYIAIDAPYSNEVRKVNQEINQFAENITGFSKINLLRRTLNLGPVENFLQSQDEMFKEHDALILLEDDNIVAKNFLVYMNEALDHFKDDPKCYAICGYHFIANETEHGATDIYLAPHQAAWGVGLYKHKYVVPKVDVHGRPNPYFLNPLNLWKVHLYSPHMFPMYMGAYLASKTFGDVIISMYCFKNGLFNVYPCRTKVINNGFDGTGVHCGKSEFRPHLAFADEDQLQFTFRLDPAVNSLFTAGNRQWFKENIPIRRSRWLYAYIMYLAGLVLGQRRLCRVLDSIKGILGEKVNGSR